MLKGGEGLEVVINKESGWMRYEVKKKTTVRDMVWLKGGVLFLGYVLLFWASGFFGAAEGRCYFLLFWGRQPHHYMYKSNNTSPSFATHT